MTSRIQLLCILIIVAVLCIITWVRTLIYFDETTLWGATAVSSPNKARVHNNYGHGLKEAHRPDEAMREFEWALRLKPAYPDALNNLATIYFMQGKKQEGRLLLQKSLILDPDHLQARFNLAMYFYESNLLDDALREYREIQRIAPFSKEAAFGEKMLGLIQKRKTTE